MILKNIAIITLMLFGFINAEQAVYPVKGYYDNTPFRVDETLQEIKPGKDCLEEFNEKGGSLVVINPNSEKIEKFTVKPGDDVRISCSAGWCRSQTAYLIFEMFDGIKNSLPHGTRYFFDPIGKVQWDRTIQAEKDHDEFETCFGFKRALRVGHKEFIHLREKKKISPELLAQVTGFYDDHYFGPKSADPDTQRVVYITFAANAHAILYRLNQTNQNLDKHIVVCIDIDDFMTHPLAKWNTYPKSALAYANFAKILMNFFDFSELKFKKFEGKDPYKRLKQIVL